MAWWWQSTTSSASDENTTNASEETSLSNPERRQQEETDLGTEKNKEKKEDEELEEEGECLLCVFMKGGACRDSFIAWDNYVESAKENSSEDDASKYVELYNAFNKCMENNRDYYGPFLKLLEKEKEASINGTSIVEESKVEKKVADEEEKSPLEEETKEEPPFKDEKKEEMLVKEEEMEKPAVEETKDGNPSSMFSFLSTLF